MMGKNKKGIGMMIAAAFAILLIVFLLFVFYFVAGGLKKGEKKEVIDSVDLKLEDSYKLLLLDYLNSEIDDNGSKHLLVDYLVKAFDNNSKVVLLRDEAEQVFSKSKKLYSVRISKGDKEINFVRDSWIKYPFGKGVKVEYDFIGYDSKKIRLEVTFTSGCDNKVKGACDAYVGYGGYGGY